jgi:hypothetical protein
MGGGRRNGAHRLGHPYVRIDLDGEALRSDGELNFCNPDHIFVCSSLWLGIPT